MERFVWRLAGLIGVHPGRFTIRQLVWMAEGRRGEAWAHTSSLLSKIHNVNVIKDKDLKPPEYFNPMVKRRRRTAAPKPATGGGLKELLQMRVPAVAAARIAELAAAGGVKGEG